MKDTKEFKGVLYDARHGGPFDRGTADSWYDRPTVPHYYEGATKSSPLITEDKMTEEQIREYFAGYNYNELHGGKKDWD